MMHKGDTTSKAHQQMNENSRRIELELEDHPPGLPREWVKEQILYLVKAANQYGSKRHAFEFLTGRPLSANETHGNWFARQLDEQIGELSDAQLFTLFVWAHSEWQRAKNGRLFSLPINSSGMQFAEYTESTWTKQEAA
jgi:hypothetical protein